MKLAGDTRHISAGIHVVALFIALIPALLSFECRSVDLSSWVEGETYRVGEPVAYGVELVWNRMEHGTAMPAATIGVSPAFETRRPSRKNSISDSTCSVHWTWELIPVNVGQHQVPPVTVSLPWSSGGDTLLPEPISLFVHEAAARKGTPRVLPLFVLLFGITGLWWLIIYRKQRICVVEGAEDPSYHVRDSLRALTRQRLMHGTANVPTQLHGIFQEYLRCRLGRRCTERRRLSEALEKRGVSRELIEKGVKLLAELDDLRFSGMEPDEITAGALEGRTASLVEALDNELQN